MNVTVPIHRRKQETVMGRWKTTICCRAISLSQMYSYFTIGVGRWLFYTQVAELVDARELVQTLYQMH